eukprot:jgi/Botrbrau1/12938/Bobra.92_1s0018.1
MDCCGGSLHGLPICFGWDLEDHILSHSVTWRHSLLTSGSALCENTIKPQ